MTTNQTLESMVAQLFRQARLQFGNAVRGCWFHESLTCPGCGYPIELGNPGRQTLSLNAFMDRKRGLLIGYLLCDRCADRIMRAARKRPGVQIALHDRIEQTLIKAYQEHVRSMDA